MGKFFEYKFDYCKEVYDKIIEDTILTKKEKECLKYLVQGLNCENIAEKLKCSPSTIKNRRKSIYHKLNNTLSPISNETTYMVYILIFPNKKYYIGRTFNTKARWQNGEGYKQNKEMYADIQKYGWENIEKKILYRNLTPIEAKRKENETIVIYKSYMPEYGYNKSITE